VHTGEIIRDWAASTLKLLLPRDFEQTLERNRRRLPPNCRPDLDALILIELAETAAKHPTPYVMDDTLIQTLLWRIRKRLQRQAHSGWVTSMHLEGLSAHESSAAARQRLPKWSVEAVQHRLASDELIVLAKLTEGADSVEIQRELGLSRATYYRRLKGIREKLLPREPGTDRLDDEEG